MFRKIRPFGINSLFNLFAIWDVLSSAPSRCCLPPTLCHHRHGKNKAVLSDLTRNYSLCHEWWFKQKSISQSADNEWLFNFQAQLVHVNQAQNNVSFYKLPGSWCFCYSNRKVTTTPYKKKVVSIVPVLN